MLKASGFSHLLQLSSVTDNPLLLMLYFSEQRVGDILGALLGNRLGPAEGNNEGMSLGWLEGSSDGEELGSFVGFGVDGLGLPLGEEDGL